MPNDDEAGIPPEERSADLGSPDVTAMRHIQDLFDQEAPNEPTQTMTQQCEHG